MWQLGAAVAVAVLFTSLLGTRGSLGENVGNNSLALTIREDRSSPADNNLTADVTLIIFTDYRCPACRASYPAMKRAVAKDGKVRIVYKDWPIFGDASQRAAEVAVASDSQHIYPLVHDRLMTGGVANDDDLRVAVERSGGDWPLLQRYLTTNRTHISERIGHNRMQAFKLGLEGTPAYLIGPILVRGALKEEEFTRVFRQARQK